MVAIVVCEPMGCVVGVTDSPAQAQDRAEELAFRSEDLEPWEVAIVMPRRAEAQRRQRGGGRRGGGGTGEVPGHDAGRPSH